MGDRATPPGLSIRLLGGFEVRVGGQRVEEDRWRLRKAATVVKLLALADHHRLPRERLLDLLWPDLDPVAADNNLRQVLHCARRALGSAVGGLTHYLTVRAGQLELAGDGSLLVDVDSFLAAAAHAHLHGDQAALRNALRLYPGPLLPDDVYDDWVAPRREALQTVYLELLAEQARSQEACGDLRAAIETFERVLAVDPSWEPAHVGIMRLRALRGERYLALRQYRQLSEALRQDLDVAPASDSDELHRAILTGRFPPRPRPVPARHNLPTPLSSFIGREAEMGELRELLAGNRLLTLTGSGGCGKSRLALELARRIVHEYADGAWIASLSALPDSAQVAHRVASVLALSDEPGRPLLEVLTAALAERRLLLILDDCDRFREPSAALTRALLTACPALRILATSRQRLAVEGEVVWRVPSLSLPPAAAVAAADLEGFEAPRLFAERARLAQPGFALSDANAPAVAEICRRLDGMPLAIELAAARVRMLSPEQIAARLDDRFRLLSSGAGLTMPRHHSLRATIDWSYELLPPAARRLLERLSVFAGSWTLEAAEAVGVADGITADAVVGHVSRLVDRSFVVTEPGPDGAVRFRLLETMSHYAAERLAADGASETLRRRHAAYYLALAETAEPELNGPRQASWLARLDADHDNFTAALDWALGSGEVDLGLRLATGLVQFWVMRGYHREGVRWLRTGLARQVQPVSAPEAMRVRARALASLGLLQTFVAQGAPPTAEAVLQESLDLWRELGDSDAVARVLPLLATLTLWRRDFEGAGSLIDEALRRSRELGDRWTEALALGLRGELAFFTHHDAEAEALLKRSVAQLELLGDHNFLAQALGVQAHVAIDRGKPSRAQALLERSLALAVELDDRWSIPYYLEGFAALAAQQGSPGRALRLLGAAEGARERAGEPLPPAWEHAYRAWSGPAQRALGEGLAVAELDEGRRMTLEDALAYAVAVEPADTPSPQRVPLTVG